MTLALLLGLAGGTGALLVLGGLFPARVPLEVAISNLHVRRALPIQTTVESDGASARRRWVGRALAGSVVGKAFTNSALADLRVVGITPEQHMSQRLVMAVAGLVWAPATAALMWAGGVNVPIVLPLWLSLVMAPIGLFAPSLLLRSKADERRRDFRHAFSSFLDIVAVSLAGGQGVESALTRAANAGEGWAFLELRQALFDARLRGESPWEGLAELGALMSVRELEELAASAALAGTEGARVRASVGAKAKALRHRSLTDVEAAAQSASERMSLPIVLLMVGFVVFLGYPAITKVVTGL